MRHQPRTMLGAALCTAALFFGGGVTPAAATPAEKESARLAAHRPPAPGKVSAAAGRTSAKTVCGPPYVTGDPDLGPKNLPGKGYLGKLLRGYVPLGGLTPQRFLSRYWDYAANDYRYPAESGFGRSGDYPNGRLQIKQTLLLPGMGVDRFGGYGGAFLAPLGTPYVERSLPPRNLNTNAQDSLHLCNYHAFRVLKAFRVESGPAAPAFQQRGGGTQYHMVSRLIPEAPQTNPEVPVSWLLENGYLVEIEPADRLGGDVMSVRPPKGRPAATARRGR